MELVRYDEFIADRGAELLSLRIVEEQSPELEGDSVARREVTARLLAVKGALEEALREAVAKANSAFETATAMTKNFVETAQATATSAATQPASAVKKATK